MANLPELTPLTIVFYYVLFKIFPLRSCELLHFKRRQNIYILLNPIPSILSCHAQRTFLRIFFAINNKISSLQAATQCVKKVDTLSGWQESLQGEEARLHNRELTKA